MSEINSVYEFMKKLAKELAADYEEQYSNMEPFARWNLPDEIALEWIDAEGMVEFLVGNNKISTELEAILYSIIDNFTTAFEKHPNVYSHEEMIRGEFWKNQRCLAEEALRLFSKQTIGIPSAEQRER